MQGLCNVLGILVSSTTSVGVDLIPQDPYVKRALRPGKLNVNLGKSGNQITYHIAMLLDHDAVL